MLHVLYTMVLFGPGGQAVATFGIFEENKVFVMKGI
jgi:hypothetical protein